MTLHLEAREQPFQNIVMSLLDLHAWRAYHAPDNRPIQSKSGRRYVQNVRRGFPDVVAVRGVEIIIAELKTEKGRLSADQVAWLDDFRAFAASIEGICGELVRTDPHRGFRAVEAQAPIFEVHVWRPSDLQAIEDRLSRPPRRG